MKLYQYVIKEDGEPLKGSSAPMVDLGTFKSSDWTSALLKYQLPCNFGSSLTINFAVKQV